MLLYSAHKTPFVEGFGRVTGSSCCIIIHMGGCTGSLTHSLKHWHYKVYIIFRNGPFLWMICFINLDDSLISPSILTLVDFFFSSLPSFPLFSQTWAYLSVMRPLSMSYSFDSSGKVKRHLLCSYCCSFCFHYRLFLGLALASPWLKHTPFFSPMLLL